MTEQSFQKSRPLLIFGGTSSRHISSEVCRHLDLEEGALEISKFADGETGVKILDNVRGADCYLIQSSCSPVNENLMELMLLVDAMARASAASINVVMPYFGYARQDRKEQGRVALSAKLMANLISKAGATRVICLDLHSAQIQGFFDVPVDHLYGGPALVEYIKRQDWSKNLVVVSPDVGNVKMVRAYASRMNSPFAIIDKRRPKPNVSEVMNIVGDVTGHHCLLVDDIIDTAGTLCNAAVALVGAGALSVSACATHAVLSEPARENIQKAPLDRVVVTDSILQPNGESMKKFELVSVAPMFAEAIYRIYHHLSVSELFEKYSIDHLLKNRAVETP